MSLASAGYACFVAAVVAASAAAWSVRGRRLVLLAASCGLYASAGAPRLLLLLAAVTAVTFACGRALGTRTGPGSRRAVLWVGLAACAAALAGARAFSAGLGATLGVSYWTLQAASYLLDVHAGVAPPERDPDALALHLAFFPKLLQGPLERAGQLLPQLHALRRPAVADLAAGAPLVLWGLFQKVVVADRLGPLVDAVYGAPTRFDGLPLVLATWLLAAQLYYDFAGYTDVARGVARMLGVGLSRNFDAPYAARSVAEFWRRWHMSFSSWLLDYVFRPLQLGLRDWRTWGTPLALLATFLASGLWHGTSFTFLAWGGLHGAFLAASTLTRRWRTRAARAIGLEGSRLRAPLQTLLTFQLVCLAWVFFRAPRLGDALHVVRHAVTGLPASLARVAAGQDLGTLLLLGRPAAEVAGAVAALAAAPLAGALLRPALEPGAATAAPAARRWTLSHTALAAALVYAVAFLGTATRAFLYQHF